MLNPLMITAAKSSLTVLIEFLRESKITAFFEGEMFIRTIPSILLQIFCEIILNSKGIVKSILDPD